MPIRTGDVNGPEWGSTVKRDSSCDAASIAIIANRSGGLFIDPPGAIVQSVRVEQFLKLRHRMGIQELGKCLSLATSL
jgi:hypothetical protein